MPTSEQTADIINTTEEDLLDRTWQSPPGFWGWFLHVNHRSIGKRFIVTAFVFLVLGGIEALVMRLQLSRPGNDLLSPDLYNQFFTMHGTTMMFFFAVPVMEGFAIYLTPLMIGTRDMAFPRLNAFGYYVYVIAGAALYIAFFLGMAPDAGWFAYVPLSNQEFSPGMRLDLWATMITFIELSALVAAVELIVTILKMRTPGMSLHRMPLFIWAILVTSFMIVFAMPPVMVASLMLAFDRTVDTHFFEIAGGGDALLWQHLFWFFGHPEVYIIFLPAMGMLSSLIITFSRRRVFGYTPLVLALVATGFIGFGLWVHHMFAAGLPHLGMSFFTAASMIIAIPAGTQIFCWIATLWGSRPDFRTPLMFALGFFAIFVAGGLTGVMIASVPFNIQVHDTFFIVAHLHYVLIGGAVFPLLGATFYWFPKMTGRLMSERAGHWSFWLAFIGFNVTFFPMHNLGLIGMPRRVYTYLDGLGWNGMNMLATIGAFVFAAGIALFLLNALLSAKSGPIAGRNPWNADTLEWSTSSPPPNYNFRELPVVEGRYPLWDATGANPHVVGLRDDRREVLVTTVLDAVPQCISILPGPSPWPVALAASVSVAFIGMLHSVVWIPVGFVLTFAAMVGWHWPRRHVRRPPWEEKERPTD
jgi:cytochrome c oxidase subunit I+III